MVHDDGKLLKKKNTFTDFIDCRKYVIMHIILQQNILYAEGVQQ
jgi:oligopeptidase B